MITHPERRVSIRYSCSGLLQFTRFNWNTFIPADMTEFSEEGLRFVWTDELKPGSCLVIRVGHVKPETNDLLGCLFTRSLGIVEVKWCRPIEDRSGLIYAIGVQYFLPD